MKTVNDLIWLSGKYVFWAMMGLSLCGLFAFDTPFNEPFIWSWHHLALPVLVLGWLYGYSQRQYFLCHRQMKRGMFWFCMMSLPPLVLLFSGGIVSLVNGSLPSDRTVAYRGPIEQKFVSGGRYKECEIRLFDVATRKTVTLSVSSSEYSRLSVGQIYARSLRIGLLGIPFRPMRERRAHTDGEPPAGGD